MSRPDWVLEVSPRPHHETRFVIRRAWLRNLVSSSGRGCGVDHLETRLEVFGSTAIKIGR